MLTTTIDETLPVIEEDQVDGWDEFPDNYFGEPEDEEVEDDGSESAN